MELVQILWKISVEDPSTSKKTMKIVNIDQENEFRRMSPVERLLKKWKGVETQSDESSESFMTRSHRGESGTDVLTKIFRQHQGVVDDDTFQGMLERLDENVRSGELDNSIYEVLKAFDENRPTSNRRGSGMFRPTGYYSDEGKRSFLKTKTQEELKQKTGLNELRRAIFRENPQVSFYLYEGIPFAYRYTDILPNSGLTEEFLHIMSDTQENNLELVPLQNMMQDPEYQPALMEYLRRSHQSTRFQSTQTQTVPELLEQSNRIQGKQPLNQQHRQVIKMMKEKMPKMMEDMLKEEFQDWAQQNLNGDDQQFQRIMQGNRMGTLRDVDEESQEEQRRIMNMMMQDQVADPWMQM
ncbi:hypothetical protein JTB14_031236 [Gonioctena quinquepunctata]|nr:hypothetical protein JTB14_031236 [Gonioctena quinquepunctata]